MGMSTLVPAEDIERIVGARRHPTEHLGRAISAQRRTYILHPQSCLDTGIDLRDCSYSRAMDRGTRLRDLLEDTTCRVAIFGGRLVLNEPYEPLATSGGTAS
jgi:hypothetical protein